MFERYTEKARRVIFFSRYEAARNESPYIEAEHLLLGLAREDQELARDFLGGDAGVDEIKDEIGKRWTTRDTRQKASSSIDLPLSNESKRILAYAAEEAQRLDHRHIGTEHLFLGILREEKSFAAQLLSSRGIRIEEARRKIAGSAPVLPMVSKFGVGGGGGGRTVRASLWIEFQNEADGSILGDCAAITVPRIGEEIVLRETRGRISNISYHYAPGAPETRLIPQKIVIALQLLQN